MAAQLGSSRVWLKAGNVTNARREAEGLLASALSTADPELHALAWEMKSRVAMAEKDGDGAEQYLQRALAILENSEAPLAAWRVHATAWDLYGSKSEVRGKDHLRYAQELIESCEFLRTRRALEGFVSGCCSGRSRDGFSICSSQSQSLMQRVVEPGKIAGWVAPPDRGINNLPVDYEYVKLH